MESFAETVLAGENTLNIYKRVSGRGNVKWAVSSADVNFSISTDTVGVTVTLHCFEAWPICVSYQF